jgi:hypothetical protein
VGNRNASAWRKESALDYIRLCAEGHSVGALADVCAGDPQATREKKRRAAASQHRAENCDSAKTPAGDKVKWQYRERYGIKTATIPTTTRNCSNPLQNCDDI